MGVSVLIVVHQYIYLVSNFFATFLILQ